MSQAYYPIKGMHIALEIAAGLKKKYPDLQAAFGNDKAKYFKHFVEHGMKECRQARSTFNPKKYRARYKDLDKAFGDNWPEYYKHYCQRGKKENRKAT